MEMTTVSVVIPARNDAAALADAIATVRAQRGVDIAEIVIAVGPSSDDTEEVARALADSHPVVHVVNNPTGLTPAGLNVATQQTTGDVVVSVDARSQLPLDYIANALETMDETGAGNVGALQLPVGTTSSERGIAAAMRSRLGSGGAQYRHATTRMKVETAYLGVFTRAALDSVGGFDEGFIRNQDSELNIRLRKAGHEVWLDPRMVVEYRPRPSLRTLASQYWQYGWWRANTVRRHPSSMKLRQAVVPVAATGLVATTVLGAVMHPVFFLVPGTYVLLVVGTVAVEPTDLSWHERTIMARALMIMHLCWGGGMIASVTAAARARTGNSKRPNPHR